jgi:hypothetical protein
MLVKFLAGAAGKWLLRLYKQDEIFEISVSLIIFFCIVKKDYYRVTPADQEPVYF